MKSVIMINIIALNCVCVNKNFPKYTIFMVTGWICKKLQIVIFALFTKILTRYIQQVLHKIQKIGVFGRFNIVGLCKVHKIYIPELFDNAKKLVIIHFAIG